MPYLPPEIWFMIISFLDDQSSLSSLCQVSKQLHEIATPLLYESPNFATNHGYTTDETFRTLIESPHLAQQVTKLREGFDCFAVSWQYLSPAVEDVFNRHVVALLSLAYSLPEGRDRDDIDKLLKSVVNKDIPIDKSFCRSVLMSLLPNLWEMRLSISIYLPHVGIWPDTLTKLTKVVVTEYDEFEFRDLKSLSKAATNLDSLSFTCTSFSFRKPLGHDLEIPMFLSVTNLNLGGCGFYDLEIAAMALFQSFPALQSFRFYGNGELDCSEVPTDTKVGNLLRALRHQAPQLKHFCLGDASDAEFLHPSTPEHESAWPRTLKIISSFGSLETLSIDNLSIWPFDTTGPHPTSVLSDCLPPSIVHLHLEELGTADKNQIQSYVLAHIKACICKLAQAISEDAKFDCLKLVSFSSNHKDEDLSEALEAMEEAGFPMVRQDCPWSRDHDWLYGGK